MIFEYGFRRLFRRCFLVLLLWNWGYLYTLFSSYDSYIYRIGNGFFQGMGPSKAFDSLQQNFLLVVLRVNLRNGEKIENSQTPISEKHNNSNQQQDQNFFYWRTIFMGAH